MPVPTLTKPATSAALRWLHAAHVAGNISASAYHAFAMKLLRARVAL